MRKPEELWPQEHQREILIPKFNAKETTPPSTALCEFDQEQLNGNHKELRQRPFSYYQAPFPLTVKF